jgi:hypothetical protein
MKAVLLLVLATVFAVASFLSSELNQRLMLSAAEKSDAALAALTGRGAGVHGEPLFVIFYGLCSCIFVTGAAVVHAVEGAPNRSGAL